MECGEHREGGRLEKCGVVQSRGELGFLGGLSRSSDVLWDEELIAPPHLPYMTSFTCVPSSLLRILNLMGRDSREAAVQLIMRLGHLWWVVYFYARTLSTSVKD